MSNLTDLISAGGGGSLPVNIVLTKSQTWVPPADGNICIHVIGAGGGGLGKNYTPVSGGAGGYCKKTTLAVTTSGSFTVVVGAHGLGGWGVFNAAPQAGGNSTVAGTGLSATLTANGGSGASFANNTNGAGGTASNGDVNNTGGAGGFGGGGAVGIHGTGNAGEPNFGGGGSSDAIGPLSLAGYGYIYGGHTTQQYVTTTNNAISYGIWTYNFAGEFLAGGGSTLIDGSGSSQYVFGGRGGVGGGGGGCRNWYGTNKSTGGDGGVGIVIIQYLPA